MLHVIAFLTAKPGQREAVLREFRQIVPTVRAEKGCIEYAPATDTPNAGAIQTPLGPDTFAVVEKWESIETLAAHAAAPHMSAFGARVKDLVAGRVVHVLSGA